MKLGIELKIDVTKIDKSKLYQGAKGTYLTATVFIDPENTDQYGNHGMITESLTKEEREEDMKGSILGNAKVFWSGDGQHRQPQNQKPQHADAGQFDDPIPFIDPYKHIWRAV